MINTLLQYSIRSRDSEANASVSLENIETSYNLQPHNNVFLVSRGLSIIDCIYFIKLQMYQLFFNYRIDCDVKPYNNNNNKYAYGPISNAVRHPSVVHSTEVELNLVDCVRPLKR